MTEVGGTPVFPPFTGTGTISGPQWSCKYTLNVEIDFEALLESIKIVFLNRAAVGWWYFEYGTQGTVSLPSIFGARYVARGEEAKQLITTMQRMNITGGPGMTMTMMPTLFSQPIWWTAEIKAKGMLKRECRCEGWLITTAIEIELDVPMGGCAGIKVPLPTAFTGLFRAALLVGATVKKLWSMKNYLEFLSLLPELLDLYNYLRVIEWPLTIGLKYLPIPPRGPCSLIPPIPPVGPRTPRKAPSLLPWWAQTPGLLPAMSEVKSLGRDG